MSIRETIIYCMSNISYHGVYLIGSTNQAISDKELELHAASGVVYPFRTEFVKKVKNFEDSILYSKFYQYKITANKDFYRIELETVRKIFDEIEGEWYNIGSIVCSLGNNFAKYSLYNNAPNEELQTSEKLIKILQDILPKYSPILYVLSGEDNEWKQLRNELLNKPVEELNNMIYDKMKIGCFSNTRETKINQIINRKISDKSTLTFTETIDEIKQLENFKYLTMQEFGDKQLFRHKVKDDVWIGEYKMNKVYFHNMTLGPQLFCDFHNEIHKMSNKQSWEFQSEVQIENKNWIPTFLYIKFKNRIFSTNIVLMNIINNRLDYLYETMPLPPLEDQQKISFKKASDGLLSYVGVYNKEQNCITCENKNYTSIIDFIKNTDIQPYMKQTCKFVTYEKEKDNWEFLRYYNEKSIIVNKKADITIIKNVNNCITNLINSLEDQIKVTKTKLEEINKKIGPNSYITTPLSDVLMFGKRKINNPKHRLSCIECGDDLIDTDSDHLCSKCLLLVHTKYELQHLEENHNIRINKWRKLQQQVTIIQNAAELDN